MAISDTKLRTIHGKPYSGPQEVADADGLSVRISPKGVIQFQYRYRWHGKPHRLGIGRYPSVSLKDARQITSDLRNLYFSGTDPRTYFEEKTQNSLTVAQCLDYWFENYVSTTLREKTQALYRSTVMKRMHDAFPNRPASSITVKQWVDLLTEEERDNPRRARQVLSQLRSAISWCMRRQVIDSCAIMSIQPRDFGSRAAVGDRVLSYNELAQIWMAIERSRGSTSNRLLHQLLMLYGARNSELRLAIRGEFDREEGLWVVPAEKSKTNKIIRRPIFSAADDLLKKAEMTYGDILFPGEDLKSPITISGANKFLRRIKDSLGFGEFTSHDFRRTLATRLSEEGVAPHVIEKMLGHELGGVLSVYNKHDWIAEQKDAYDLYAEKIFWHIRRISG